MSEVIRPAGQLALLQVVTEITISVVVLFVTVVVVTESIDCLLHVHNFIFQ